MTQLITQLKPESGSLTGQFTELPSKQVSNMHISFCTLLVSSGDTCEKVVGGIMGP